MTGFGKKLRRHVGATNVAASALRRYARIQAAIDKPRRSSPSPGEIAPE